MATGETCAGFGTKFDRSLRAFLKSYSTFGCIGIECPKSGCLSGRSYCARDQCWLKPVALNSAPAGHVRQQNGIEGYFAGIVADSRLDLRDERVLV